MNVGTGPWINGVAHLSVAGEIDMATVDVLAKALREALTHADTTRVVVDFAGVTFCDSAGLAALDKAYAGAARQDTVLQLVGLQPAVRGLLELVGMLEALTRP
jgi:anti-anti-sigma factor